MAWWTKAVEDLGPQPATIERIRTVLDGFGYDYEELPDGRGLSAGFNGVAFLFLLEGGDEFVEVSAGWLSELGEDQLATAAAWANGYNRSSAFPRVHASMTPNGLGVFGESYFWAGKGVTDQQLSAAVAAGISTGVRAITEVRELLGDPIPANLQGND